MSKEKPLSDKLKDWRAERPDEWKMDEFIRDATLLEGYNRTLEEDRNQQYAMKVKAREQRDAITKRYNVLKAALESDNPTAEVAKLVEALDEMIDVAQRVDGWESFPSAPIDRAVDAIRSYRKQGGDL